MNKFFYPSQIKVLLNLKRQNNNVYSFAKSVGLTWNQVKNTISLLFIYNLVNIEKVNGVTSFNLTEDGLTVRNKLLEINSLVEKNRKASIKELYSVDKKEIDEDLK